MEFNERELELDAADEGGHSAELEESSEHVEQDPFTSLMFGSRKIPSQKEIYQEPVQNGSYIDYEELMVNIDTLMESLRGLKPLFKNVYPYFEQIWKKK